MTIAEIKRSALTILTNRENSLSHVTQSPELDIAILLSTILGKNKTYLLAHNEIEVTKDEEQKFYEAINKRKTGLPIAYITGVREFWGLPFQLTPSVLIPKQDTEILVERALIIIEKQKKVFLGAPRVLDVCTGSGCIAIALKHSMPEITITATDISADALHVAKQNSDTLVNSTITFIQGDLRKGIPSTSGGWNLIVSNPPYVPSKTAKTLLKDGRNEPLLALDGGADGLDLIRTLIPLAFTQLTSNGYLLLETGEYNAQQTATYLMQQGFVDIVIHTDLENQDRVVEGKKQ